MGGVAAGALSAAVCGVLLLVVVVVVLKNAVCARVCKMCVCEISPSSFFSHPGGVLGQQEPHTHTHTACIRIYDMMLTTAAAGGALSRK